MKAVVEKIEKDRVKIEVEIDAQEFDQAVQQVYIKNRAQFAIPGFRKGKAPRKVIERYVGEGIFHEDAFKEIFPKAYIQALNENTIETVDEPENIDIVQMGDGLNLKFTVEAQVQLEPELGKYKGIEVSKVEYNVADEDVEDMLKKMREQHARWISVEDRGAVEGDRIIIEYSGYIDDELIEALSSKRSTLDIGKDSSMPWFDEHVIGMKLAESKQITLIVPDFYADPQIVGKQATFHINMLEIKQKEVPDLDDEFAKDASEYDTLEQLKDSLKKQLQTEKNDQATAQMTSALISAVYNNSHVVISDTILDHRVDFMFSQTVHRAKMFFGRTLEELDDKKYISISELKAKHEEEAYEDIKTEVIFKAIAKIEGITPDEDEIQSALPEDLRNDWKNIRVEHGHKYDMVESVKEKVTMKKVADFLMDNAVFVEATDNMSANGEDTAIHQIQTADDEGSDKL